MQHDFFDPPADELRIVAVGAATLHIAQQQIESCEYCHPDDAEIPFDWILDRVTGVSGEATDYILTEPGRCPNCKRPMTGKTLIEPKGG